VAFSRKDKLSSALGSRILLLNVQAFQVGARISCFSKILLAMSNERNTADLGECFVSLTFTVAVFWREILTVDVKVKKIILKSFMYYMKLAYSSLLALYLTFLL
jgi:hypothetical protein